MSGVRDAFWEGKRVLLTGHTGFKGAWLSLWLQSFGAEVTGFANGVPTQPSLYELARVGEDMRNIRGDVRDHEAIATAMRDCRPEIVIHMAAQSLVRRSFDEPRQTFETNVMGTVNVLEAARTCDETRVVINVTSDKCYASGSGAAKGDGPASDAPARDRPTGDAPARDRPAGDGPGGDDPGGDHRTGNDPRGIRRAHAETDPLGGADPYSGSKACAELATDAYRRSFFAASDSPRVATARAGNVIGGGDWAKDRLLPDIMRAALDGEPVRVRNPHAIRPWQHVTSPLSGYLMLAQALWDDAERGDAAHACAWNFGPAAGDAVAVDSLIQRVCELWPEPLAVACDPCPHPPEAPSLMLDSSLAATELGWTPAIGLAEAVAVTVEWYLRLRDGEDMRGVTLGQIEGIPLALDKTTTTAARADDQQENRPSRVSTQRSRPLTPPTEPCLYRSTS